MILLNGPPGIGKSTLAQRYIDDHAGVLNLDIDQLRALVGGSLDNFSETGAIVRPVALAMAATHLGGGRDVIVPQYLGRSSEIERFESAARTQGASFVQIVLMDSKEHALDRFARRGDHDERPWHRQVQQVVASTGGRPLLSSMYDQLADVVRTYPGAVVVPCVEGAIDRTYRDLLALLVA